MDEKDYTKHVINERVIKSFSLDMQPLGMIKDFMKRYHNNNFSKSIDDLVNVGLANFGYRTEKEIETRFKGVDIHLEKIAVPTPESLNVDLISIGISRSQHERMEIILDVIERLCTESFDDSAVYGDIINEAEIQGVESKKVEETIDRLNRNGKIYETSPGKYRISD
jgi:hypothetical protein